MNERMKDERSVFGLVFGLWPLALVFGLGLWP